MSDLDKIFFQTCVCGHTFTGLNALTQHEKSCVKGKKCLSGALSRAKEAYQRKRFAFKGLWTLTKQEFLRQTHQWNGGNWHYVLPIISG